jgi:hypothetical protein
LHTPTNPPPHGGIDEAGEMERREEADADPFQDELERLLDEAAEEG